MKNKIRLLIAVLPAFLMISCSPLYTPQQKHVDWAKEHYQYQSSVDEFQWARTQYTQYCQSCHDLHMPSEFTVAEWEPIYKKMSAKISVSDSVKQKIYYYIIAGAKDAKP